MMTETMDEELLLSSKKVIQIRETVNSIRLQIQINPGQDWNVLCAIMDRIEDTVAYLDEIREEAKKCPF